ncbi:hypothetical protein [Halomonas nitroreducens]|uniref:Outer membrane protein beta-barrel domain-containing protein n=1 Tax=Halomonas nitroreducens TaxID=447425 RepID=A0A431V4K4_9GAMM|nr:hypothetical protein [Halomonas nitroreducens]RTR04408.1 hypothetical protein EKG36_08785 [Halomonas nitroreducens]
MKKSMAASLSAAVLTAAMSPAQAFDDTITVSALAGTTGAGADISWRFHERFGLTAQYAGGLQWDGDHDTDEVNYEGDLDVAAAALKLDIHPFAGRFYLTVGAMLPDMEAKMTGTAEAGSSYELDGTNYNASDVGSLRGQLTIADGIQPYAGFGWRSSHEVAWGSSPSSASWPWT